MRNFFVKTFPKLATLILLGQIFILSISFIYFREIFIKNLENSVSLFTFIAMIIIGIVLGFGIFMWKAIGIAGEYL